MKADERRQSKRVLFTIEDGIVGILNPINGDGEPVTAQVVNMSSGGIRLIFKSILNNKIKQGDRLVLSEIKGETSEQVIVNIDTEVRWISEDELSESIGLGCEFLNILEDKRAKIEEMVEFWYMQKL